MAELTPEQKAEVERLVANGFSEERAVEIATEVQLDVVLGMDGKPLHTFEEALAKLEAEFARSREEKP